MKNDLPDPPSTVEPADTNDLGAPTDDGREAARYRRKLRDTEQQLEAASAATTAAQRTLIDHLAATQGRIKPEALWASGVQLEALLDDDGNVDPERVTDAADTAANALGLTRKPKVDPSQGRQSLGTPTDSWNDAFGPNR